MTATEDCLLSDFHRHALRGPQPADYCPEAELRYAPYRPLSLLFPTDTPGSKDAGSTSIPLIIRSNKGGETTLLSIVQAMLIHGMIVQGRADDKHYGVAVMGAPKKKDLADCEKLGERVAALVLKLNPT